MLTRADSLEARRKRWRELRRQTLRASLADGFERAGVALDELVTSSRTFPTRLRVDVTRALADRLAGAPCMGAHRQYGHDTLTFASLLQTEERVSRAPIQHDEIDVGADEPVPCARTAIWVAAEPVPHVVLLSPALRYGHVDGWHVEIAVPPGEDGATVVRSLFGHLESAVARSATYRGKVLSLEKQEHMGGASADVIVHRLPPVAREDVILPPQTLELLDRNVFTFAAQRPALRRMGLPVKKGLLFYGPPGTGKTHTIRYLAGALPEHTTLVVTAEQVGLIAEYMALARLLSPSIVVIEDADLIARQREQADVCEEVLLNRLLNEMDGLKENAEILFVLTTNRPQALEVALTARPGRIDQAIEFPLPDAAGRRRLAQLYGAGASITEPTLAVLVERTDGVSAAFIKELVRRSAQFALERHDPPTIEPADVDAALNELLFVGGRLNAALLGAVAQT